MLRAPAWAEPCFLQCLALYLLLSFRLQPQKTSVDLEDCQTSLLQVTQQGMFLFPVVTTQSAAEEQCWISSPAWVHLSGEPGSACNCWRGTETSTADQHCRNNVIHMLRAKLRASGSSCGESILVLQSRVWGGGTREMLSLSNCINTRARTKLSEVRHAAIFWCSCAHMLEQREVIWVLGCWCHPHSQEKDPWHWTRDWVHQRFSF